MKDYLDRDDLEEISRIASQNRFESTTKEWFIGATVTYAVIILISIIGLVYQTNFSGTFTELQIGWMVFGVLFLSIFCIVKCLTSSYWWAILICFGILSLMIGNLVLLGIVVIGIIIKLICK
jgi:hypothetical protein